MLSFFQPICFKNKTLLGNHAIPCHFQNENVPRNDCLGQAVEGRGECELFGQNFSSLGRATLYLHWSSWVSILQNWCRLLCLDRVHPVVFNLYVQIFSSYKIITQTFSPPKIWLSPLFILIISFQFKDCTRISSLVSSFKAIWWITMLPTSQKEVKKQVWEDWNPRLFQTLFPV